MRLWWRTADVIAIVKREAQNAVVYPAWCHPAFDESIVNRYFSLFTFNP
jgi:hypothetical protein